MVAALNRIWIGFCHFSILLSVQALARLGKFVPETQAIECREVGVTKPLNQVENEDYPLAFDKLQDFKFCCPSRSQTFHSPPIYGEDRSKRGLAVANPVKPFSLLYCQAPAYKQVHQVNQVRLSIPAG